MANSFINKKSDLTSTDLTTVYTVPSFKTAVVKSILVSDDSGSGDTITVTLVDASTNVTVILAPDPASSDTKIDFTTAVLNDGTVYSVVRSVVVKSAFLFIKLFAIMLKRSLKPPSHLLILVDTSYLIFVLHRQDP